MAKRITVTYTRSDVTTKWYSETLESLSDQDHVNRFNLAESHQARGISVFDFVEISPDNTVLKLVYTLTDPNTAFQEAGFTESTIDATSPGEDAYNEANGITVNINVETI